MSEQTLDPDTTTLPIDPTYRQLLEHTGLEVLDEAAFGSYQGDLLFAVREGDRYGVSVIGYGSCSGCDALEYLTSGNWQWVDDKWPLEELRKVDAFAQELAGQVRWGQRGDLNEALTGEPSLLQWYRHDRDYMEAIQRVLTHIPAGDDL